MPVALRYSSAVFCRAFAKRSDRELLRIRSYQTERGKAISYRRKRVAVDNENEWPGRVPQAQQVGARREEILRGVRIMGGAEGEFGIRADEDHAPSAIEGQRWDVTGIAYERGIWRGFGDGASESRV